MCLNKNSKLNRTGSNCYTDWDKAISMTSTVNIISICVARYLTSFELYILSILVYIHLHKSSHWIMEWNESNTRMLFEWVYLMQSLIGKRSKTNWCTKKKASEPTRFDQEWIDIYNQTKMSYRHVMNRIRSAHTYDHLK